MRTRYHRVRMALDYRRYPLLYVDDDVPNQVAFRYAMEDQFHVLTATGGRDALRILAEHDVAVLLTDQRMPEMSGVELCTEAAARFPNVMRVIVTAYADVHAAIGAINSGQVSRYILKPWRNEELVEVLQTCIDFVHLRRTMHDMELRLLGSGQHHAAVTLRGDVDHGSSDPLSALALSLDRSSALIAVALDDLGSVGASVGDGVVDSARAKLREALQSSREALVAAVELGAVSGRVRDDVRLTGARVDASCDVTRVVDAAVRSLRAEIEQVAELVVSLDASPVAAIDASSLGRVMLNVLLNAAHSVSATDQRRRRITVSVSSPRHETLIRVQASATGALDPGQMHALNAHAADNVGHGLGMSVVRESVQQAGGRIVVQDCVGGGATFEVYLPLARNT